MRKKEKKKKKKEVEMRKKHQRERDKITSETVEKQLNRQINRSRRET